jgi:hypothetical protein
MVFGTASPSGSATDNLKPNLILKDEDRESLLD